MVGEEGVLIIDTQFEDSYEQLIGLIGEVSEKPIKYVLNTNWHFDHVVSNALLAKNGASIIAHYLIDATNFFFADLATANDMTILVFIASIIIIYPLINLFAIKLFFKRPIVSKF